MKSALFFCFFVGAVMALPPSCSDYDLVETIQVTMGNITTPTPVLGHVYRTWTFWLWIVQLVLAVLTLPAFLYRGFYGFSPLRNRLFGLGAITGGSSLCLLTILTALVNGWTPFPPVASLHAFICVCVAAFFAPFFLRIVRLYGLMSFNVGQYRSVLDDAGDLELEAQAHESAKPSLFIRTIKSSNTHMILTAFLIMIVTILALVGTQAIPSAFRATPALAKAVGHTPYMVYLQFLTKVIFEFLLMVGMVIDIAVFVKNRAVLTDSSHILLELCISMGIFTVEWILSITLQWATVFKATTGFPAPVCAADETQDTCFIKPFDFNALGGNALNETCQAWEIDYLFTFFCLFIIYHVVVTLPLIMSIFFSRKLARFKLTNVKFELEDIRADPRAHEQLVKFVASEFAFENYAFIDTIARFKQMSATNANLEAAARKIAERYIGAEAPLQINISAETEMRIKKDFAHSQFTPNMFEHAVSELRPMFQHDLIPRFLADNPMLTNNAEIKKMAVQRIAAEKQERARLASLPKSRRSKSRGGRRSKSRGRRSRSRRRTPAN